MISNSEMQLAQLQALCRVIDCLAPKNLSNGMDFTPTIWKANENIVLILRALEVEVPVAPAPIGHIDLKASGEESAFSQFASAVK